MALDFKQTSKKSHGKKSQPRHDKAYKAYKGRHLPVRKLMGSHYIGDWYSYVRAPIERWLYSQVDRPIDKVFSDFVKEVKKTYKGEQPPHELFYNHVDKEKDATTWHHNKFYVSSSGFLCRYSKYNDKKLPYTTFNRRRKPVKAHVDFNKEVLKDIKMGMTEYGPKYLGKVWAKGKGVTKIVNVWIISRDKWEGYTGLLRNNETSASTKEYLKQFTPVSVEGYGCEWMTKVPMYSPDYLTGMAYKFIAKLSDLQ